MGNNFVNSITQARLPDSQYMNDVVDKDQIFIHHTASSSNPYGVLEYWGGTAERVATAFLVAGNPGSSRKWKDGEILQCFYSRKWGWHLGLKSYHLVKGGRSSQNLNAKSVGIEICNWGFLSLRDGKYVSYAGAVVPEKDVVKYDTPYRGHKFYQKYTDAQIESTRKLLIYLCDTFDIDPKYKGYEIFDINKRCLMGENGIWTHTSCRPDKSDCHPQHELIQMLESL